MIKLILTDMDGTFLNNSSTYNKTLFNEVKELMKRNQVIFAPCTGKQCERVESLFEGEYLNEMYILGDSATRIKHNGEFIYESLLPNKIGLAIIAELIAIDPDQTIIACTKNGAIVRNHLPESEMHFVNGSYKNVHFVDNLLDIKDDFIKITVHDPKANCVKTAKIIAHWSEHAYIVASENTWIDITNINVNKGTTVAKLQKILNISKEETAAFGDGRNDLELLAAAHYNFAVRNACPEILESAYFITQSNQNDGVLNTIKMLLTLQES